MPELVSVWQPRSEGKVISGLSVPWSGLAMRREKFVQLLQDRIAELLEKADPRQAKDLMTGSPENNPNLYQIAMSSPLQDWPAQIVTCDQMQTRLGLIDWQKASRERLPQSEMPGLQELLEAI